MNASVAKLHDLKIDLTDSSGNRLDSYSLPIGLRQVTWSDSSFLINHQPFYFKGVAKHEDSNIRGRGFDLVTSVKDYNLLHWLGANSFRTSHYPYAEEMLNLADEEGIVVISECAAVNLRNF